MAANGSQHNASASRKATTCQGLQANPAKASRARSGRWAGSVITVLLGVALWRLHMGFSQGILAALVADTTPAKLKGSAFGLFNLASGIAVLLASATATRPFANTVYRKSRPNLSRPEQFAVRQQSCLCCIFGPMLRQQPS